MTSLELQPMIVQYTGQLIQTETHDQYIALSLVGALLYIYEFSYTPFHFSCTVPLNRIISPLLPKQKMRNSISHI